MLCCLIMVTSNVTLGVMNPYGGEGPGHCFDDAEAAGWDSCGDEGWSADDAPPDEAPDDASTADEWHWRYLIGG